MVWWMDGMMDGGTDEWMDGWMDRQMDEQIGGWTDGRRDGRVTEHYIYSRSTAEHLWSRTV